METTKKEINGNFRTENGKTKIKYSLNWINSKIKGKR